jgi:flagellar basal body-associated protein FliL
MAEAATASAPSKPRGKMGLVILAVVCVVAAGSGFALPQFVPLPFGDKAEKPKEEPRSHESKQVYISFGEAITVNLTGDSGKRFVRVKLILLADEADEKAVNEALSKKKVVLRDWMIKYLSDQTIQSLTGGAGKNRVRRETRDEFNAILFPDGSEKVRDILWDEFNFT